MNEHSILIAVHIYSVIQTYYVIDALSEDTFVTGSFEPSVLQGITAM